MRAEELLGLASEDSPDKVGTFKRDPTIQVNSIFRKHDSVLSKMTVADDGADISDWSKMSSDPKTTADPTAPVTVVASDEKVSSDDFTYLKVLGKGSFGKVMMAQHKKSQKFFAIKALKKDVLLEDNDLECALAERSVLMKTSRHPFLTAMHSCFQTEDRLYFVMEMVTGGDLLFAIQQVRRFTEDRARFYSAEIVLALDFLHRQGILYRDLKLDNVMLAGDGHVKVADFGMCKEDIFGDTKAHTFCGTPDYLAPEILMEEPYDAGVDWWALGVLTYEMTVGQPPFLGKSEEELFAAIMKKKVLFPPWSSSEAISIINGFTNKDQTGRLGHGADGVQSIKSHPFFAPIDWVKLENMEIEPPFVPAGSGQGDTSNFDEEFTSEAPEVTPTDPSRVEGIDQREFDGFTFVNGAFQYE